jgi:nucleoid DNA-binding protein
MTETKRTTYGKTALVDDVTARTQGYSRRQVGEIIEATLAAIREQVQAGQNVTLTGFGTFRRSERAARTGTNIRTRERIQIPASTSVRFTPGSEFRAAVSGRLTGGSYATERARAGLGTAREVGGGDQPRRQKGRTVG